MIEIRPFTLDEKEIVGNCRIVRHYHKVTWYYAIKRKIRNLYLKLTGVKK